MSRYPSLRAAFLAGFLLFLACGVSHARPPLFLLDEARLAEIRTLVATPGTTHHEAFGAMKARVDANNIPGTASDIRGDFAREASLVYLITEDPAYAQMAYDRLEEIYTISVPAGRDAPDVGSGLARAQGIASFSTAYNWAYDAWTPEQRAWVWGVLDKALNEYEGQALSHPNIGFQQNNSNWSGVVAGAHVMTLIALDLQNVRRFDFQRSRELLRTHLASFGERGWTQEGNYYFILSTEYVFPAMMALRQIGDPHVEPSFASRRPHHIIMHSALFNAGQNTLTWGVGGDSFPPYGATSALLALVPEGEKGFYRWFYDRYRGIHNPAPAAQKYDHLKAGTIFALIAYPNDIPPEDPRGHFPTVINDNLGGYVMRSSWDGPSDTIVGLWSDTNNYGRSWNQRDAGIISILSHGAKWGYGPGPATSGLDATFSQILVNGIARTDSGQGGNLGFQTSPTGGYARVSGGSKFSNLGVQTAHRHVLSDFSPEGYAIISTYDRLRANESKTYGWNLYLPGRTVTVGTDATHDIDYFLATDGTGAYLKAWFLPHGNGFIMESQAVRYEYDAANADIWVVMVAGRGTPPELSMEGQGLNAIITIGNSVLTFDAAAERIRSSTLTDLNSNTQPSLSASPTSGLAPLTVNFGASGSADPGETLAYAWDLGDGTTSTAQSLTHTYTEEGIYTVSLEVADGQGGTDRVLRHIFVGNREPTARITASQTIVLPNVPITLSGMTSTDPEGQPLTYEWDLGDGRVMTGESIEVSWPIESVFRVFLKVTDSAGLINVARVQIRVENQPPVAEFTADSLGGFVPLSVNFNALASFDPEGEALLYRWNFDDGTVVDSTDTIITHTFTQVKEHRVRLTVFDPAGKSGTRTLSINALGTGSILPAVEDPGNLAQGLNYTVYQGDPNSGASLPEISTLRPLAHGRSQHFDHDVTSLDNLYVLVSEGFIYAPVTGAYSFRMRTQQQSHLFVGGVRVLRSSFPHSGIYEDVIALEAGLHTYRIETNYAPEFPDSTEATFSLLWMPPGEEVYRPIPNSHLFSPPSLFQPTMRAQPSTVYPGATVMFEATVSSPDGGPLSYLWEFGDGQTSTARAVAHTYQLPSNSDHLTYNAKLTVTDSTGTAVTIGEQITVSRFAGLVMRSFSEIRRDRYSFDQRTAPRDTTQAVNHVLEPGLNFSFSSQLRADLGASLIIDDNHNTRWVSAQPQDWLRFSFRNREGEAVRYNIREYSLTAGALGWTTNRDPLEWEIYGSNHPDPAPFSMDPGAANPDWTLIGSETGRSGLGRIIPTIYTLDNNEAYAHYLFHLRNQSGGVEAELELTELQLFSYFEHDPTIDGNQPPVPALAASATVVEPGVEISFDASGTTDPDGDWLYYTWDFGDGFVFANKLENDRRKHTYFAEGTYAAVLTVRDGRGATAQITQMITVLPPSPNASPVVTYTPGAETVLVGTEIVFDASATFDPDGDALQFHWEFGDGNQATGEVVTHTFRKPGLYNPMLIVTDERGRRAAYFRDIEILPPNGGRGILSFNFNRGIGRLNPNRGAGVLSVGYWNDFWNPLIQTFYDSRGEVVDVHLSATGRRSSFGSIYPVPRFDGDAQLGRRSEGKTPFGSDEGFSSTVDNIPYAVYDVYVYFGGSFGSDPRAVYVNGEARWVAKQGHGFTGEWRLSEAKTSAEVVPGRDLLVWRNLTSPTVVIEMPTRNSDGIAGFQIVDKTGSPDAPPVVEITSPGDGEWYFADEPVLLSGSALMGSDSLDDPFIRWDSDRDGFLGNGATLSLSNLSVGTHTLSLTGTNEGNLSMTASVVIDIFAQPAAPTIVTQPADLTTYETATVELTVAATGSPPFFSYRWRKNGQPLDDDARISGATTSTLVLSGVTFNDTGNYDVIVTNDIGSTPSAVAQVVVTELIAPSVSAAPTGGIRDLGSTIVLTADIAGSRPMQFQWYFNGEPLADGERIGGANTDTLTISNARAEDAGLYELVATNAGGEIPTGEVEIVINRPPTITLIRPVGGAAEIPLGTGAWLRAVISDNTVDPADIQLDWTQLTGPGDVSFTDPFAAETGVVFPGAGEFRVRLTAFDGSLSSSAEVVLTVRGDLDNVAAPVGEPLVNDFFDWGSANLNNNQIPADSGWRFGTNNVSYLASADGTWSGTGSNPYVIFGDTATGGALRANVQHNPRGVQRDFPATVDGQRWSTVLVRLVSGFDTSGHTAVFSFGNNPSYSGSAIRGEGFGFRQVGDGVRLVAMSGANVEATADTATPLEEWILVVAKTTVDPDGPDSIALWTFTANDDFGLTESSLGEPDLTHTGFDWGAGIDNLWIGALRSAAPSPNFDVDELRVSTEGGDRGLGQVIAELDAGIQIGAQVAIEAPGAIQPGEGVALVALVNDPDSHPQPVVVEWLTVSGPGAVSFADPTASSTMATFPVAGSYLLRLIADDGAVATYADRLVSAGGEGGLTAFDDWMVAFADDIPADRRGPADDFSGDGFPHLLLYALDRDPRQPLTGSARGTTEVRREGGDLVVTLPVPSGLDRPGLRYRVRHSHDLVTWTTVAEANGSTAFVPVGAPAPVIEHTGDSLILRMAAASEGAGDFFLLEVGF